jgi:hypothetical protein
VLTLSRRDLPKVLQSVLEGAGLTVDFKRSAFDCDPELGETLLSSPEHESARSQQLQNVLDDLVVQSSGKHAATNHNGFLSSISILISRRVQ